MPQRIPEKFKLILTICAFMIGVHIINVMLSYQLNRFGVFPRHLDSIWTILTAPFLHGSLAHLLNNLLGLCIFSALILVHSVRRYLLSSVFIIVSSGLLVWLFGRSATHIGASGWVFGLWSLCIATAWFERRVINIVIAVFVIIFYGGLIYGVLPVDARVSFEYHLFGALMGFYCAYLNTKGYFIFRKRI
jgi:membrane associated rhomboid family serine protease